MLRWFVVETHPKGEFRAQENLTRQDFLSFLPRFRKTKATSQRVDQVILPAFPGYMFVRFDPERDHWRSINSTYGVRRLVSFGGERPQPMPQAVMDALLARCEAEFITYQLPNLAKGDEVRLISGPLADKIGRIEQFDGRGRVEILLELLGRVMRVKVRPEALGPVAC